MNDEVKSTMRELVFVDEIRNDLKDRFERNELDYDWTSQILDILSMRLMDLEDEVINQVKNS